MKIFTILLMLGVLLPGITSSQTANCSPGNSWTDLNIANVRARIFCGADMWRNLSNGDAEYEVPIGSGRYSMYAGSLWLGAVDDAGNLRTAAQTYRQAGNDFWPGPIDTSTGTTTQATCQFYNRLWKLERDEVALFAAGGSPTQAIMSYPGNGDSVSAGSHYLAPFVDVNSDGIYNYLDGDYPEFDSPGSGCGCSALHGDQVIWWVINDMGNTHNETDGLPLGVEIRCQAFAFSTTDEAISNATFYEYQIINYNTTTNLNNMWMGIWADADLGNYLDDYVGCDVGRGLAYAYNGDENDEGISGYGMGPPAIGVKFLLGPGADEGDGIDNDRDSCIDCTLVPDGTGGFDTIPETVLTERIKMNRFIYYNNTTSPVNGVPAATDDYYGYLRGIWKNGNRMTYGGNGTGAGPGATTDTCDFMYPANSDPCNWGTYGVTEADWDEVSAGNLPDDRRFLMSAGHFTMLPGEVQCVSMAVLWARDLQGRLFSLEKLKQTSDYIDSLAGGCIPASTIGVEEFASRPVQVFPNPATNSVTLAADFHFKDAELTLYDISGKIIFQKQHLIGERISFSVKEYDAGIYLYKVKDNNKVLEGRVVIQ